MAIIDSDSAILYTGGAKVYKGTEYANLSGTGNSIIPSVPVGISINRSPFVRMAAHQPILVSPTYTYSFEKDTTLLFGNFVVPDYYVTNVEYSSADISLDKNVESATVVQTSDVKEITRGEITALVYVKNSGNKDTDMTINIYGTSLGLIHSSQLINIPSHSEGMNAIANYDTSGITIPAGEVISFTATVDENDITITGSDTPSQIRLVRKNL